jgi:hypothetical protein
VEKQETFMSQDLSDALTSNYLLVSVGVGMWSAKRTDKEAGEELTQSKGANAQSATVIKKLMADNDREFNDTRAAYTKLRTFFYARTIPWAGSKSDGLIGVGDAMAFMAEFATMKTEAEKARDVLVHVFEQQRPALMAALQTQLGGLFNPADYPTADAMKHMWSASLQIRPLPAVSDFSRVNVPAALVKGLQGLYQRQATSAVDSAVADVRERLVKALERMVTQLSKVAQSEKTRLYETMLSSLDVLCRLAESLAPVDATLDTLAKRIRTELLQFEIEQFKGNASLSRSVAEKAAAIAEEITGTQTLAYDSPAVPPARQHRAQVDKQPIATVDTAAHPSARDSGAQMGKEEQEEFELELPDIEDLL